MHKPRQISKTVGQWLHNPKVILTLAVHSFTLQHFALFFLYKTQNVWEYMDIMYQQLTSGSASSPFNSGLSTTFTLSLKYFFHCVLWSYWAIVLLYTESDCQDVYFCWCVSCFIVWSVLCSIWCGFSVVCSCIPSAVIFLICFTRVLLTSVFEPCPCCLPLPDYFCYLRLEI